MGELTVTMQLQPRGPAGAFVFSEEQVATIGEGAMRFPARVTIDGRAEVRGSVNRMRGEFLFGMSKAVRAQSGVEIGDTVTFTIARDDAPREVDVPEDLAAALGEDPALAAAFAGLAFSHRKEFARWVTEAKQPATRARRIAQTVQMVREGRTRS